MEWTAVLCTLCVLKVPWVLTLVASCLLTLPSLPFLSLRHKFRKWHTMLWNTGTLLVTLFPIEWFSRSIVGRMDGWIWRWKDTVDTCSANRHSWPQTDTYHVRESYTQTASVGRIRKEGKQSWLFWNKTGRVVVGHKVSLWRKDGWSECVQAHVDEWMCIHAHTYVSIYHSAILCYSLVQLFSCYNQSLHDHTYKGMNVDEFGGMDSLIQTEWMTIVYNKYCNVNDVKCPCWNAPL